MYAVALWCVFQPEIAALGSDDYVAREAAEARLSRWADLAWPLLDWPYADPERRRRARRVVARTLPGTFPPVAVLSGRPLPEWELPGVRQSSVGRRPGPEWRLAWERPDRDSLLGWVVRYYGERARTQHDWPDWHRDDDGREATRLLARDLLALGVPAPAVRRLLGWMKQREEELAFTAYRFDGR